MSREALLSYASLAGFMVYQCEGQRILWTSHMGIIMAFIMEDTGL